MRILLLSCLLLPLISCSPSTLLVDSTYRSGIGFGCGASGRMTFPVNRMGRLLEEQKLGYIKSMLFSNQVANQFLASIVVERLSREGTLQLSEREVIRLLELKHSERTIAVCEGCTYWDRVPLRQLFERYSDRTEKTGADIWYEWAVRPD